MQMPTRQDQMVPLFRRFRAELQFIRVCSGSIAVDYPPASLTITIPSEAHLLVMGQNFEADAYSLWKVAARPYATLLFQLSTPAMLHCFESILSSRNTERGLKFVPPIIVLLSKFGRRPLALPCRAPPSLVSPCQTKPRHQPLNSSSGFFRLYVVQHVLLSNCCPLRSGMNAFPHHLQSLIVIRSVESASSGNASNAAALPRDVSLVKRCSSNLSIAGTRPSFRCFEQSHAAR